MDNALKHVEREVYEKYGLEISNIQQDHESKAYGACQFRLNGKVVLYRNAKITPKKLGQFVTFWKRKENGPIEPFRDADPIDFYVVTVISKKQFGQFVFPKSILIKKGIISTQQKEGKRAFRVYPKWDNVKSTVAQKTQKWQLDFFYEINDHIDFDKVSCLYNAS